VVQQLFGMDPSNPRDLGALVWNACVLMARYLHQQLADELAGRRVLELGAGLGVVGLAAVQRGADSPRW
jgi:predicted nicotinamide N-methyase